MHTRTIFQVTFYGINLRSSFKNNYIVGKMSFLIFSVSPRKDALPGCFGLVESRWRAPPMAWQVSWHCQMGRSGCSKWFKENLSQSYSGKWGFSKVWLEDCKWSELQRTCFLCYICNFRLGRSYVSWWECTELFVHIYWLYVMECWHSLS